MGFVRLLVAAAPLAVLLGGIVWLRWRAYRAAALAWLVAVGGAAAFFGAGPPLLAAASAKGLSLALLVMLIVWAAVFLYSLMHDLGAVAAIAARLIGSTRDPMLLPLLLGWSFAGFIQGIAGFGVPVTILTPLLLLAGLSPVRAVAAAMIGPTWAITFGSMGSSFYAIRLVTGLDERVLGPTLALLGLLPVFATGVSVVHIAGGWPAVRRLWPLVLVAAVVMVVVMWGLTEIGAAALASMLAGLAGSLVVWGAGLAMGVGGLVDHRAARSGERLSLGWALLPYLVLTILSIAAQLPLLKRSVAALHFALSYPAQTTSLGLAVQPSSAYAPIQLVGHPAPLLLLSALILVLVFKRRGLWKVGALGRAWRATVQQTTGTTVGVGLMVMMALVVTDSGMAAMLAQGAAALGGAPYLVASPFVGAFGAFATGSSTNSNVMFGPLQLYAARALAISPVLVAAAQTLGGATGSGVAPDKALIGVSVVGKGLREGDVMRQALPYALVIVLLIGLEALLVSAMWAP